MSTPEVDKTKAHQHFSVSCFNDTWGYIDKENRTPEDDEAMLQLTMASAWHWSQREDCQPSNLAMSYWQIARVQALIGRGDEAVRYGKLCMDLTEREVKDPFSLGYAYEAMARAEGVAGNTSAMHEWLAKAKEAAEGVEDDGAKKMLLDDLATIT